MIGIVLMCVMGIWIWRYMGMGALVVLCSVAHYIPRYNVLYSLHQMLQYYI